MLLRSLMLIGLSLAVPLVLAPTPALAQFEIKTCPKCKEKSITSKANCLKCGTPFAGAPAPAKAKAKAKPVAPAKTKAAAPAKAAPAKAAPAKAQPVLAKPTRPAPAVAAIAKAKAKGKAAPVVAKPEPPAKVMVSVELPSNPYETGLTALPVKAVARGVKAGTKVELWTTTDGKLTGKQARLAEQTADQETVALVGNLKLDKAGEKVQVIAVAALAQGTWVSQPIMVSRFAQSLPKPAEAETYEAYLVEGTSERKLDLADPALPVGTHQVKFYAPGKAKPERISAPLAITVGAAGRASSATPLVAMVAVSGTVEVKVTKHDMPVPGSTVELVSTSDATRKFTSTTGANGVSVVREIPPGTYRLRVNRTQRDDIDVKPGATTVAGITLKPTTLQVVTMIDRNAQQIELTAVGPEGRRIRVSDRPIEVPPDTYRLTLDERVATAVTFAIPAQQTVVALEEGAVQHVVELRRRRGNVALTIDENEAPIPQTINFSGTDPLTGQSITSTVSRASDSQTRTKWLLSTFPGSYTVSVPGSGSGSEWGSTTVKVLADQTTELTLRRVRGPLTIALANMSIEERQFNEADLRFTLRDEAGTTITVRAGRQSLARGNYTVAIDPASIPKDWQLVGPLTAQSARVPGAGEVTFALAPRPKSATVAVTRLVPRLRYLVSINARPAQIIAANEKGELSVTVPPGESDLALAAVDFEYLAFATKVTTPQTTTVAATFAAKVEGEIVSARNERALPRNTRVLVTLELPSDTNWVEFLKGRNLTLPRRLELTPGRDGRIMIPAHQNLPAAPYRVTLSWQEEDAGVRTKIGANGRQDVVFDVVKKPVSARGEVVWRPAGK